MVHTPLTIEHSWKFIFNAFIVIFSLFILTFFFYFLPARFMYTRLSCSKGSYGLRNTLQYTQSFCIHEQIPGIVSRCHVSSTASRKLSNQMNLGCVYVYVWCGLRENSSEFVIYVVDGRKKKSIWNTIFAIYNVWTWSHGCETFFFCFCKINFIAAKLLIISSPESERTYIEIHFKRKDK